jgi:hypothetical protein
MSPLLRTHLVLGRVSNLPTVWTNGLAGAALAGLALDAGEWVALLLALTLFYTGGMYLNDAFDAEVDARERPSRPIPSGLIGRGRVFAVGASMLALGVLLAFTLGAAAGLAGLALAAAVLLYDWLHKRTDLAPLLMGACRFMAYVTAALAAGGLTGAALAGAAGLFAHVVGLTYAARQEAYDRLDRAWPLAVLALPLAVGLGFAIAAASATAFALLAAYTAWCARALSLLFRRQRGDVPRAVIGLIAGISLYDATLIAAAGAPWLALLAAAGLLATLALQRVAPGT